MRWGWMKISSFSSPGQLSVVAQATSFWSTVPSVLRTQEQSYYGRICFPKAYSSWGDKKVSTRKKVLWRKRVENPLTGGWTSSARTGFLKKRDLNLLWALQDGRVLIAQGKEERGLHFSSAYWVPGIVAGALRTVESCWLSVPAKKMGSRICRKLHCSVLVEVKFKLPLPIPKPKMFHVEVTYKRGKGAIGL